MGDAVFNVVERMEEDVELAVPKICTGRFVAGPIHIAAESLHQLEPCSGTLGSSVVGVGVKPMLKSIHGRNPRQNRNDLFQVCSPGPVRIGRAVKNLKMFDNNPVFARNGPEGVLTMS